MRHMWHHHWPQAGYRCRLGRIPRLVRRRSAPRPDRLFQLSLIKYPASITAQSIIINGSYNQHYFGLFIKNINYGTFDFRTDDNIKMGTFTAGDTHFKIGYARHVYKDKLVLGTNAGIFLSQIDNYNAKLITASPSILLKGNAISLGVSIEKLGRIFESYTNENIKQFLLKKNTMIK